MHIYISSVVLLLLLLPVSFSNAALVNVTVDDSEPDPAHEGQLLITYDPAGQNYWKNGIQCGSYCDAWSGMDPNRLHDGTWHDGLFAKVPADGSPSKILTATMSFNGSAIYVFCVIATGYLGYSDMSFWIDGDLVGNFTVNPPGFDGYQYIFPVYTNTSIPPGPHTIVVQNGRADAQGLDKSAILLDSLVYSYDQLAQPANSSITSGSTEAAQHSVPIPVIVGSIVGGLAGVACIATLFFLYIHNRREKTLPEATTERSIEPFTTWNATQNPLTSYKSDRLLNNDAQPPAYQDDTWPSSADSSNIPTNDHSPGGNGPPAGFTPHRKPDI